MTAVEVAVAEVEPAEETGQLVPAAPPRRRRTPRAVTARRWAVRLASVATAVGLWHLLTARDVEMWLRFNRLPGPVEVFEAFQVQLGSSLYYQDLAQSVVRILSGFAIASVLGVGLGILLARSQWASDLLQPLLEIARPIPAIALVPVAILLFPSNEQGIVFITATAAFFPILVSTRHAVRALPTVWEDALLTMGADRRHLLTSVVLPGIVPGIFGGLSVGMGVAWICVISAEMISGDFGLGYRTWQAYTIVDYPNVLVGMLSIGAIGWITSGCVELVGRRLTRWLSSEQRSSS
ncbi:NitT/TauT family transport system permease protein [Nocardioides thalensis]|uniref:NitT/TauT family transport system permease protein n=1 Tax=Nocardioides thalensis TaxID=1914755 RepID=A0A853C2Q1_9ACTN|nr:NitT/TauT family transport system permease protein [Nocardioides thalensis]